MKIKRFFIGVYFKIESIFLIFLELVFSKRNIDYKSIPIIINNRNRFNYLIRLINSLEVRGYKNIIILDNMSTYQPLLNYYDNECKYKVFKLEGNFGHLALWKSNVFKYYRDSFYVYTDPDLELIQDCPDNFIEQMLIELKSNLRIQKIGLSLKIDDLPDSYNLKQDVINWENRFYNKPYTNDNYFVAQVDTTFALYRPYAYGGSSDFHLVLRTRFPLLASHLPWYVDSNNLSEEDKFYIENAVSSTFWSKK